MNAKIKGTLCGIISAITYGLNPLGALNLYRDGLNVDSVLFYRYGLAMIVLAGLMRRRKVPFKAGGRELALCLFLGTILAVSSFCLYRSFNYMDAGLACTVLFVYPVMVAVIMAVLFKERLTGLTVLSIIMALTGIALLYRGGDGAALNGFGVALVILAALSYAVYMVTVNKSGLKLPPLTLTFYVMLFGIMVIVLHSLSAEEYHLQWLTSPSQWLWALMLAVVPTVMSMVLMVMAIKEIGTTPTAIMGALEPVTAVVIGVTVFSESFSSRIALGMLLILAAVSLIIAEKPLIRKLKQRRYQGGGID